MLLSLRHIMLPRYMPPLSRVTSHATIDCYAAAAHYFAFSRHDYAMLLFAAAALPLRHAAADFH